MQVNVQKVKIHYTSTYLCLRVLENFIAIHILENNSMNFDYFVSIAPMHQIAPNEQIGKQIIELYRVIRLPTDKIWQLVALTERNKKVHVDM